jgi:hypothetical protein
MKPESVAAGVSIASGRIHPIRILHDVALRAPASAAPPENTMADCADCIALNLAPASTSPHANLLLHSDAGINFGGTATGHVEYYVCHACGAKWARTVARSEPEARWEHTAKQLS